MFLSLMSEQVLSVAEGGATTADLAHEPAVGVCTEVSFV